MGLKRTGVCLKNFTAFGSADDVDAKIGEVRIKLTFLDEGPVKIVCWPQLPFVGKVNETKGPYEVQGDTISSKAIRGGTKAKYWFEGER